jgi:tetratricopeptide (TPR) repeat protein
MSRIAVSLAVALALGVLGPRPALAQAKPAEERPWAKGVSQENQKSALELFRAGNTLLKESIFVQAAEKYRQALALWDHPAIHYNMALALLNLDQPIEVHQHLEKAMRFGAAPLDSDKFENARAYKTLIEKQLSKVELTCEAPGATVTMDGKVLFVAPGRYEGLVRPGRHTIVATKEGHPPTDVSRALLPGEEVKLALKLYTTDELTRYSRLWSAWKPWAVVAGGAAIAAGGAVLHLQARGSYQEFDDRIAACGGCVPPPDVTDKRTKGDSMQNLAFGTYALGGAALATGFVLVYINRSKPYQISPNDAAAEPAVTVVPLVGRGEGGALATFRF